jgi:hypothetical protein
MKLVRLIEMFLNELYIRVHRGKHLSENFPVQKGLKERGAFQLCFRICH